MTRLSPDKMHDGIDFDAVQAEEAKKREGAPQVIDTDGEVEEVLKAFKAIQAESAVTQLGDRALANEKRTEVKRNLDPNREIGGAGLERGIPTLIREPSAASEARTLILPPSERPADKQFHSREDIVAFAKAQGVKTTAPGTPKSFWKNVLDVPDAFWRIFQKKPVESKSSSMQEVAREPLPDSTPFQMAQTEMARTVSPDQTSWFRVEPTARAEAPQTEQQKEFAIVNALREQWRAEGLLEADGTISDDVRQYPELHGGPEAYARIEAVSKMQQDRFLTESRTVNN